MPFEPPGFEALNFEPPTFEPWPPALIPDTEDPERHPDPKLTVFK